MYENKEYTVIRDDGIYRIVRVGMTFMHFDCPHEYKEKIVSFKTEKGREKPLVWVKYTCNVSGGSFHYPYCSKGDAEKAMERQKRWGWEGKILKTITENVEGEEKIEKPLNKNNKEV